VHHIMMTGLTDTPHDPTKARAWIWLACYVGTTTLLYWCATHLPVRAPWLVPATPLDSAIPLLPWTAPIYLSYFLLLPVMVQFGARERWFIPAFLAACVASGFALVWHLLIPTAVIRQVAPAGAYLLQWIQKGDAPLGAFPSLHIGLPVAIAVMLIAFRSRWALIYAAWAVALAVTVLTTKQHVAWDVVGGIALGLAATGLVLGAMRTRVDLRSFAALGLEWLVIILTLIAALRIDRWWMYATAFLVIATRQHALLMLFHDAVHGLLSQRRRVNDTIINLLVGVPHLVPIEVYRPLHLAHHRDLGTERDPERRFLYAGQSWQYRPLPKGTLLRQLAGDLLVVNGARTISAWRRSGAALSLAPGTWLVAALWVSALAVAAALAPARPLLVILLLWFVPLVTLTNLLQKIRSFAEHSGGPGATAGWPDWTYSWRVGLLGRLTIWPYHINLHREHHARPAAPWHSLPAQVRPDTLSLSSADLGRLLWAYDRNA
jgi:fatty acid desaturase